MQIYRFNKAITVGSEDLSGPFWDTPGYFWDRASTVMEDIFTPIPTKQKPNPISEIVQEMFEIREGYAAELDIDAVKTANNT